MLIADYIAIGVLIILILWAGARLFVRSKAHLNVRWRMIADRGSLSHRFPPPWSVEEQPACFVVRDHNGQQLAYVYFEDEPGRRSAANLA
jgi:hypothetical protein